MGNIGKRQHLIQLVNVTSSQNTTGTWKPNDDDVIYTGYAEAIRKRGQNNREFGFQDQMADEYEFQIPYQTGLTMTVNTRCIYKNRVYKLSNIRLQDEKIGRIIFDGVSTDAAVYFDTI